MIIRKAVLFLVLCLAGCVTKPSYTVNEYPDFFKEPPGIDLSKEK